MGGVPEAADSARALGVRPGIDVSASTPVDLVQPGKGGLSVSPDDPLNLPTHRRPPDLQGTGKDPVWCIDTTRLGPDLFYRPDPSNPLHGFIEPAQAMTLTEFQLALARTQSRWQPVAAIP